MDVATYRGIKTCNADTQWRNQGHIFGRGKIASDFFPEISLTPIRCRFYCRFGLFLYTNLFTIGGRPFGSIGNNEIVKLKRVGCFFIEFLLDCIILTFKRKRKE